MLRRLELRDVVIVTTLELDFHAGFSVLTGETGAGKSILIDALQLALGARADAGVVREGAARAEVSAEFDTPAVLRPWLEAAGFALAEEGPAPPAPRLLLRRTVDAQGRSRAWINGSPATVAQLREAAEHLVDIHGQHAWQSLTRAADTRALLDAQAGADTAELARRFAARQAAAEALQRARTQQDELARERDRLAWQIAELDKLAPAEGEWAELSAEQQRLAHAQALIDAAVQALALASEGPGADGLGEGGRGARGSTRGGAIGRRERPGALAAEGAEPLLARASAALQAVATHDARIAPILEALHGALAQVQDAAHALQAYLASADLDPDRLAELDARMGAWLGLARRWRRPPEELPALLAQWRAELRSLEAAADLGAQEQALADAHAHWQAEAARISALRRQAAAPLAQAVTRAMQGLGMAGGRFEVALQPLPAPQAGGLEAVEFLVAGHAGATPRPLGKVASGGELSRLALAIAVTTVQAAGPEAGAGTLIFDEIDAGVGGAVGDIVGAQMKQLGRQRQVLAVTHLAQVAACGDQHLVVSKATGADGRTVSRVLPVAGEARVAEVARMLGGERMASTSLAHAQAMLSGAQHGPVAGDDPAPRAGRRAGPSGSRASAAGTAAATSATTPTTTAGAGPRPATTGRRRSKA